MKKEGQDLKLLGSKKTDYKLDNPSKEILETFENKTPENDYVIRFGTSEFSSLCPKTNQPDFAKFTVEYIPDKKCIESKSLKLYFFAFRNYGSFAETITNKVLEDLVSVCFPRWMEVVGAFAPRGGISLDVTAEYKK